MKPERGQYRSITVVLLDGPDFQELPAEARWVFVCLKCSLGPCGIQVEYPASLVEKLAARTGYAPAVVAAMLDVLQAKGWVRAERNVVWAVGQLQAEPSLSPKNDNHKPTVLGHIKGLPRLGIVGDFIRTCREYFAEPDELVKAFPRSPESPSISYAGAIPHPIPHPMGDQGKGQGQARSETEEVTTATQSAGRAVELVEEEDPEPSPTEGQVLAAVRRVLWAPDGRPPADDGAGKPWTEGREIKVIRALVERGETTEDLIRAVHGLRLLQERGDVDWLVPNSKVTLRAIYNSKNGSRDMLTQALDAYASGPPPPEPKPGQRKEDAKRADFLAGIARLKRTG